MGTLLTSVARKPTNSLKSLHVQQSDIYFLHKDYHVIMLRVAMREA